MIRADRPRIGILAGSGTIPAEVARAVRAAGGDVHIVRIDGDCDGALAGLPVESYSWGQIGAIFASFRRAGCRELLFIGGVRRPDLTRLRPDAGLFWHLPGLIGLVVAGGDDGLARHSIRFVERQGFTVVGLADVAPDLLVPAGALGQLAPDADDMADILLGSALVRALGSHDIGQAVLISGGVIEAIEGAEGTDRMLERIGQRRAALGLTAGGPAPLRGVLVKRPKPGQEMRIDMPAIGPRTIDLAHSAGLKGIAVLAGQTLAADRAELIVRAGRAGVFVYGFTEGDSPRPLSPAMTDAGSSAEIASRQKASASDVRDARKGAAALASLATLGPSGSVVVVNGYIIGIEPTADVVGLIERTRDIRPWGVARWRRRAGVVVIGPGWRPGAGGSEAVVAAAMEARLAAVAVVSGAGGAGRDGDALVAAANAARLCVIKLLDGNASRAPTDRGAKRQEGGA